MPPRTRRPVDNYFARLDAQKARHTRQIASVYRESSKGLPEAAERVWRQMQSAERIETIGDLGRLPAWRDATQQMVKAHRLAAADSLPVIQQAISDSVAPGVEFIQASTGRTPTRLQQRNVETTRYRDAAGYIANRQIDPFFQDRHERILANALLQAARVNLDSPATRAKAAMSERIGAAVAHTLTVANTETANVGRALVLEDIGSRGEWEWVARLDDKTDDYCRERHGRRFPASVIFTAPHPNCRCVAQPV